MIYVEIIGGLGNQMFQYALYLKLSKILGDEKVSIDCNRFNSVSDNKGFELKKVFGLEDCFNDSNDFKKLIDDKMNMISRIRRKLFGFKKTYIIEHDNLSFKPEILKIDNGDFYLRGLWQSELYFKDIKNLVLEKFNFNIDLDEKNESILNEIVNSDSVSVHIRRGDYLSKKYYDILGDVCDRNYYINAFNTIISSISNATFYIFSDDIEWVKENILLELNNKITYINWNIGDDSFIDMFLMSKCKHNIIANSTFSWWGAYLNINDNKIVVTPKRWFKTKKYNNDIIPEGWIKI